MLPDHTTAPRGVPRAVLASPDMAFADAGPRLYSVDIGRTGHPAAGSVQRRPMAAASLDQWRDDIIANAFTSTRRDRRPGAVVVLGGSSGGFAWSNQVAALLATSGLDAIAVAYHDWSGAHGLPTGITEQPLELFAEAARRFRSRVGAVPGPLMAVGFSKGAEALLALAEREPVFDRVAAISPSSHVWESVRPSADGVARSCWSWKGRPLPFTPLAIDPAFYADYDQSRLLEAHSRALAHPEPESRIDLGGLDAEVLVVAATDDETWPATGMAEQLTGPRNVVAVTLAGAGHLLLPPGYPAARAGGAAAANAAADRRMWTALRRFLKIT